MHSNKLAYFFSVVNSANPIDCANKGNPLVAELLMLVLGELLKK